MNGWTPERRKRQAELIRTWKPWEQSTGARTEEGKARSAHNSFKHGLFTAHEMALRQELADLIREARRFTQEVQAGH